MYNIKDSVFNIYLLWLLYLQFVTSSFQLGQGVDVLRTIGLKTRCRIFWQTVSRFNLTLFLYGEIKFDLFLMPWWCLFIAANERFFNCQNIGENKSETIPKVTSHELHWLRENLLEVLKNIPLVSFKGYGSLEIFLIWKCQISSRLKSTICETLVLMKNKWGHCALVYQHNHVINHLRPY